MVAGKILINFTWKEETRAYPIIGICFICHNVSQYRKISNNSIAGYLDLIPNRMIETAFIQLTSGTNIGTL